jgi:UPF0755 protein
MLGRGDRKIVVIAIFIFLFSQTIIFASIPRDTDSTRLYIIVKNGTSLSGIANMLKEEGVIHSATLFILTSLLYRGQLIAGEYVLRKDMSTLEIVRKMGRSERNLYTLKIIEGNNIYTVADTIADNNIMGKDEFLRLARDQNFLRNLGIKSDSLEGYLSPDTYYYSKEIKTDKLIEKIVQRTLKYFEREDIKQKMAALNLDVNKTLTLASMIEKEAKLSTEKPLISAVFHNRLSKGMSFDSDPTVIYGTRSFRSPITKSDLMTYTPYNTYTFKGFPKGPICSPDKSSILAALSPAPVDYLYFVSKNDGTHVFSKDMNEHNKYVELYQRVKTTKK